MTTAPIFRRATRLASASGIAHGFFGSRGGVSQGVYASLNCGLGSKDERAAVLENRTRVAQALLGRDAPVLTAYQIHSATAVIVDQPWAADAQPQADALITRTPGLVLGALAADCTPVLFADPSAGIIAAAHAGWKGALADVLGATVAAMERIGATRGAIIAAIGPTISQANYEVGEEFRATFVAEDPAFARYFNVPRPGAKPHFDLPGFVEFRLRATGIGTIERATTCTYADDHGHFSYRRTTHRREPDYGRQISAIALR